MLTQFGNIWKLQLLSIRFLISILGIIVCLGILFSNHSYFFRGHYSIRDYHYQPVKLQYNQLWHEPLIIDYIKEPFPVDKNKVPMCLINGALYYHPVFGALSCLDGIQDYSLNKDFSRLQYAVLAAETLRKQAIRFDQKLYFPYYFDFKLFNQDKYTMQPPWSSGMAQGLMLSVYSRLYYFTGERNYAAIADSIQKTFADYSSIFSPVFISRNDKLIPYNAYYWVDEYPNKNRAYVLNGSIIGSLGLYDHWWVFGDQTSAQLLSKQLSSIRDNIHLYRNPGQTLFYDLDYTRVDVFYHKWVINGLNSYYLITNDSHFASWRDSLEQDFHLNNE